MWSSPGCEGLLTCQRGNWLPQLLREGSLRGWNCSFASILWRPVSLVQPVEDIQQEGNNLIKMTYVFIAQPTKHMNLFVQWCKHIKRKEILLYLDYHTQFLLHPMLFPNNISGLTSGFLFTQNHWRLCLAVYLQLWLIPQGILCSLKPFSLTKWFSSFPHNAFYPSFSNAAAYFILTWL